MKTKRLLQWTGVLCTLALLMCLLPSAVAAESLSEKIQRLKGELETITDEISGYQDTITLNIDQRNALESERALIIELMEATNDSITQTESDIADKQVEIAEKRETIYENQELFESRLVAMYKSNTASPLSTLLQVDTFSELLTVSSTLQTITQNDTDLLNLLDSERQALEVQEEEMQGLLEELQTQRDEYNSYVDRLATNISTLNSSISNAQAQIDALDTAYDETYEALVAAQEEQKRIAESVKVTGSTSSDGSQYVGGQLQWPVPGFYYISCYYGAPDPNGTPHRGMDVAGGGGNINGAPIYACGEGTVIISKYADSSYGNYVVIDHGAGIKTLYAHCSDLAVSAGQGVTTDSVIGYVGSTGFSTGPHLHLEVHNNGALQNPLDYLTA